MTDKINIETVPAHKVGDIFLVKRVMKKLTDHYPGFLWRVGINDEQQGGVMYIMNMTVNAEIFSNSPWGYILFLSTVYHDSDLKCVVRAGGEILERAHLARGKFREDDLIEKIDGLPDENQPIKYQAKYPFVDSNATKWPKWITNN